MRIEYLQPDKLQGFLDYCQQHALEHDESFLSGDELKAFEPNEDNPTYLLLNDENTIIGTASLMLEPRFRKVRKGRFRILHTIVPDVTAYQLMVQAFVKHTAGIDLVHLFLPEEKTEVQNILKSIGFNIERYSWVLLKEGDPIAPPAFPEDMMLRALRPNQDEAAWCYIVNTAFAHLAGHTQSTPELIKKMMTAETYLPGGLQMLWNKEQPIGLINIDTEIEEGQPVAFLGPIAILPEFQGMGLGRNILRAGIQFGREKGFAATELTVNAENDKAADLYLSEGFKKIQVMICYNLNINALKI